jgi:hypothetical protein
MCFFVSIHISKTFNALERSTKKDKPKLRQKLLLNGILLIGFVKLVMN